MLNDEIELQAIPDGQHCVVQSKIFSFGVGLDALGDEFRDHETARYAFAPTGATIRKLFKQTADPS